MIPEAFNKKGFTLIELMLVVAIIGLLAAIAIPKFANLVVKAKEAAIKGQLGTIRSALSIYYSDNEGIHPSTNYGALRTSLTTGGKYLDEIETFSIPTVPGHRGHPNFNPGSVNDVFFGNAASGGEWAYLLTSLTIVVNCTHTDSKGTTWSLW